MVQVSEDGKDFWTVSESTDFKMTDSTTYNGITTLSFPAVNARYVKITVRNWGTIPDGMPGAGTKAWLFVDEIEIW
jgi:hexosaminidase